MAETAVFDVITDNVTCSIIHFFGMDDAISRRKTGKARTCMISIEMSECRQRLLNAGI